MDRNFKTAMAISAIAIIMGSLAITLSLIIDLTVLSFVGYSVFIVGLVCLVIFASLGNKQKPKSRNNKQTFLKKEKGIEFYSLSKDKIMDVIEKDGGENVILDTLPESLRDNRDIVLNAVELNSNNFEYASQRLKNDLEIALAAFENSEHRETTMAQTGNKLKSNYEYFANIIEIMGQDTHIKVAKYASDKLKNDEKFAKLVLGWDGTEIQYFSKEIQQKPALAMLAIENGAPITKDTNEETLLNIIKKSPHFLDDKNELLHNKEFLLKVAEIYADVYKIIPAILKFDKNFMLELIKTNKHAAKVLPKKLLEDEDFMKKVSSTN